MPFVKKTDSQGAQPSFDTRRQFIGRMGELLFFVQNILKPEEPTHNIVSISGQGGVGKSTLLRRFIAETHSPNFRDSCLPALVDERQTSSISIMQKFADQLRLEGKFQRAIRQYEEAVLKLKTDQENGTLHEAAQDGVQAVAGAAVEGVPFVGPLLREGIRATAQYLLARYYTNLARGDAERLLDPVADLTTAFVEELNRIADTIVLPASRQAKRRRLILCFDTFEQLADVAAPWLLEYFLPANISSNVVLVVAGRTPIEHTTADPKRWLPYFDSQTIYSMALSSFTLDETRDYLAERSINDPDRIQTIWQFSRGLPLYLALLTSNPRGEVDPTKDVVVNFLRWVPEHDQIERRAVLDAALFSRPFTQDDLEAFKYVPEEGRSALYYWLIGLPFVQPQEGRYRYHELVQELFSRHLYQRSKKEYYATHVAIANYYRQVLDELQREGDEERPDKDESLELVLALTFQLFLLPDEASHIKAIEYALRAYGHIKESGELVKTLRELTQGQPANQATSSARRLAWQLLQYIEADLESQEFITAANDLLEKVAQDPTFSSAMLSYIYLARGLAYRRLEDYKQAIADFDRAIALNPSRADFYRSRGKAYRGLEDYARAIADFDRSITLEPERTQLERTEAKAEEIRRIFGRYVHPNVMQQLIDNPNALNLGGETKEISVISADIRGFTSLSERATSKEVVNVLNTYLEIMVKAIWDEEGTVTGLWGDTLMAIFNAPLPQNDHALRAVRAAWRMCMAVHEYERYHPLNIPVRFGFGLNTGEAMVGNIGSRERIQNYTAIGDTVNVAVRLQSKASDNNILLNHSTFVRVRQYVQVEKVGPLLVKNSTEPLNVYRLIGLTGI